MALKRKAKAKEVDKISGMAITALVFGIAGICVFYTIMGGVLLGIVAIVLGIMALDEIKQGNIGGRNMAIWGIILGIAAIILAILTIMLLFFIILLAG